MYVIFSWKANKSGTYRLIQLVHPSAGIKILVDRVEHTMYLMSNMFDG